MNISLSIYLSVHILKCHLAEKRNLVTDPIARPRVGGKQENNNWVFFKHEKIHRSTPYFSDHATRGPARSHYSLVFAQGAITKPYCGCLCYHSLPLFLFSSPSLSLFQSGWAPIEQRVSEVGWGNIGPLQSSSQNHTKLPVLSLLSLSSSVWNLILLCAGDLVCVLRPWQWQTACYWMGGKSYVSSLNLQPQLEAAVTALSHHIGGEGWGEFMVCVSVVTPVWCAEN